MPFDGYLPEPEQIDAGEYGAHWAEIAVAEYIQGRRREEQRAILNRWLAPYGWRVTSIPAPRGRLK